MSTTTYEYKGKFICEPCADKIMDALMPATAESSKYDSALYPIGPAECNENCACKDKA